MSGCKLFVGLISLILAGIAIGADEKPPLVARVDDEPITLAEAQAELRRVTRGQEVLPETLPGLQAAITQQLINQRLVLRQLAELKRVASDADIDQSVARLKAVLQTSDEKLEGYLAKEKINAADLRQQFRWQLSWEKYLAERCTPDNLQKFFEKHRPHFDGRERKAAHILFKVDPAADAKTREEIRQQAAAVQAEIVAKKISLATAAEKHSQGPSAKSGGDVGFIRRHEPMPESFSKAIFDLPAGECSPPIATSFGWHLVQWTEEKPGKKTWQEAEPELKPAIAVYLFEYHTALEKEEGAEDRNESLAAIAAGEGELKLPTVAAPRWTIRPLAEGDSIEQLTEMLHRAYAPHAARGLRFHASYQSADVTRSRCSEGETWVVPHDGRIIAAIIFKPPGKCSGAPCYEDPTVASFEQFAVDPDFQHRGIARQLMEFVKRRARETNASALVIDTSEHATELIDMYARHGFVPVDYITWGTTNYRSIVLRKELSA